MSNVLVNHDMIEKKCKYKNPKKCCFKCVTLYEFGNVCNECKKETCKYCRGDEAHSCFVPMQKEKLCCKKTKRLMGDLGKRWKFCHHCGRVLIDI